MFGVGSGILELLALSPSAPDAFGARFLVLFGAGAVVFGEAARPLFLRPPVDGAAGDGCDGGGGGGGVA